jgi:hypothetical protein
MLATKGGGASMGASIWASGVRTTPSPIASTSPSSEPDGLKEQAVITNTRQHRIFFIALFLLLVLDEQWGCWVLLPEI